MAAAWRGWTGSVHPFRISSKQRVHLAAFLALLLCAPLYAQQQSGSDIHFDPTITQAEFAQFSRLAGQAIFHTPVEPARAGNLLRFDIGLSATAVPIDPNAAYWQRATGSNDFTVSDHFIVPRLVVSKGLSLITVSASYAKVQDSDIRVLGGAVDVPIVNGGLVSPTLALRGSYSQLDGVDEYDLKTYGVELFLSKGFGPLTPYAAVGRARSNAEGRIPLPNATTLVLRDEANMTRYTVGVRISMFLPKLVVEATQGEERSYAAKVSFG
ncbi:MAG: hypothetical protein M3Q69_15160, partial [Acidobacteriota bacterium]|nr:hypothetical protein [Acidobacteriota bacterium]